MYIVHLYIYIFPILLIIHIGINFLGHISLYLNFRESTKLLSLVSDLSGLSKIPRISRISRIGLQPPPIQARTSINSALVKTQWVWSLTSLWIWVEFPMTNSVPHIVTSPCTYSLSIFLKNYYSNPLIILKLAYCPLVIERQEHFIYSGC